MRDILQFIDRNGPVFVGVQSVEQTFQILFLGNFVLVDHSFDEFFVTDHMTVVFIQDFEDYFGSLGSPVFLHDGVDFFETKETVSVDVDFFEQFLYSAHFHLLDHVVGVEVENGVLDRVQSDQVFYLGEGKFLYGFGVILIVRSSFVI